MSVNKDESAIFDPMEQDPEYQNKSSSSREDEDVVEQWDLPRNESPAQVSLGTDRITQQILMERDMSLAEALTAPPPSLDLMFSNKVRMGSDFSIEKVLGETTASILTEAEAEASHLATSWDIETGLDEPHSILSCRICQLFVRTVDRLLDKSDQFVDRYLPLTEEEIENLKRAVEEVDDSVVTDHQMQVCMARINNLSSKLRQRAYMMALSKLRLARRNTQESLCQLHETIGLIEQAQSGVELESNRRFSVSMQWATQPDSNPAESPLPSKIEILHVESKVETPVPRLASVVERPQSPVALDSMIEMPKTPLAQSTMVESPKASIASVKEPEIPPTPPPEEPKKLPTPPPTPPISPVEEMPSTPSPRSSIRAEEPEELEMLPPPSPRTSIPAEESEVSLPPPPPPVIPVEEPKMPPPPPPPVIPVEEPKMPPLPPPPVIPAEEPKIPPPPPPPPVIPTVQPKIPPPPPVSHPEKPPKIHRDVRNITLTEPGCEDDPGADPLQEDCNPASEIETKTLATSRSVIHDLQGTYENLLENLKDLPPGLQNKLNQTYQHITELQSDFASAHHFGDLSGKVLNKSMEVMEEAQGSLDELMEYALENPDALVWLKDNLPASAMEKKVPKQGEAEERSDILKIQKAYDPKGCDEETSIHDRVQSSRKEPRRNENILKIQKAYEPKGCDEETPPEPIQTSTPEQVARENILEILQAYDPKDCEDAPPTSREPGEAAPFSHMWEDAKEWKMFKMLQSYKPKIFEPGPPTKYEEEVEVVEPPSEAEPEDRDILRIQKAYDPKGCDSEVPPDKDQTNSSSSPDMEGWNILRIQAAHEPKGCETEIPDVDEEEEDSGSFNMEVKDLIAIEKAYDPRGCDEMPTTKGEIVPPSRSQEKKEVKVVQSYTPPPRMEKKEPVASLPDQQEKKETSALNTQETSVLNTQEQHDPKGCDEEEPISKAEVPHPESPKMGSRNILEIQKAYEPIECNEASPRVTEEVNVPVVQREDIVEIQKAYDPKECAEDT